MKANSKILLTIGLIVLVTGGVFASIKYNQRGIVDVQTGRVVRQDLVATVTASGEIKPKNYINLGANTLGPAPITEIMVKEGDRVRKGPGSGEDAVRASQCRRGGAERQHRYLPGGFGGVRSGFKVQDDGVTTAQATLEKQQSRTRPHQSQFRPRHGAV